MKVYYSNATGSQKVEALLDKDSGVIEFKDGKISHILFELQKGATVEAYKDGHHCNLVKKPEVKEESKSEASEEQSKPVAKKKSKA